MSSIRPYSANPFTGTENPPSPKPLTLASRALAFRSSSPVHDRYAPQFAASVKFAGDQTDLPNWAKSVPEPKVTMADFTELMQKTMQEFAQANAANATEKSAPQDPKTRQKANQQAAMKAVQIIAQGSVKATALQKKYAQELKKARKLYPEVIQKRVKKYQWSPKGLFHFIFMPSRYKSNVLTLEGPIGIKAKQAEVQMKRGEISNIKASQEMVTALNEELKSGTDAKLRMRLSMELITHLFKWGGTIRIKMNEKFCKTYDMLLNNVQTEPKEVVKAKLESLLNQYNDSDAGKSDPIDYDKIEEAKRCGSMGQVHAATTRSGKVLAFKILRADADPALLDQFKPAIYFKNLMTIPTRDGAVKAALDNTEQEITLLNQECAPEDEAKTIRDMSEATKHSTHILVPNVYAANQHGIVMDFVGEQDFVDMNHDPEKLQSYYNQTAGDLTTLMLFCDVIPLDLHDGNFRSPKTGETKIGFIDHGRSLRINQDTRQALLNLQNILLKYTSGSDSKYIDSRLPSTHAEREVLNALEAILPEESAISDDKTSKLADAIQTVRASLGNRKQDQTEAEVEATKTINEFLSKLFSIKSASRSSMHQHEGFSRPKKVYTGDKVFQPLRVPQLSMLAPMSNYMQLAKSGGYTSLPNLAESSVSVNDVSIWYQKMTGYLSRAYLHPLSSQEQTALEKAMPKVLTQDNYKILFPSFSFNEVKLETSRKTGNDDHVDQIKTSDPAVRLGLCRLANYAAFISPIVDEISDRLAAQSDQTLDAGELFKLKQHVRQALMHEMKINTEQFFSSDSTALVA